MNTIWVIPPEPVFSDVKNTIERLASTYQAPKFEPHMTVLGNIEKDFSEIEEKVRELTKNLEKLVLTLGPVSFSTTYFQSVFIRVSSSARLMQLNLDIKKLFDRENDVFMPHMSLLYGDHDMEARAQAASSVKISPATFTVDKLVITRGSNDPKDWEHVAIIPFGK